MLPSRTGAAAGSRLVAVASGGVRDVEGLGRVVSAAFADLTRGVIGLAVAGSVARLTEAGLRTAETMAVHGNVIIDPDVPAREREGGERNSGSRSRDERD